jgi:hypothetical protein
MQLVNFWLVAVSFLAAAFVQARTNHVTVVGVGVCITGAIASLAFMQLDARTRQLVRVAERALEHLDARRTSGVDSELFALVKSAHTGRSRIGSYRIIIEGLQLSVALLFSVAGIYAILSP